MRSRLRHFARGVWTGPAGGGRKKVSAQRFRSRRSGEQVSRCVGVERLKSKSRWQRKKVEAGRRKRRPRDARRIAVERWYGERSLLLELPYPSRRRREWELTGSCRCQGFSYRTFDKERRTTCEPRSESTRSTLITQRQSENHQLILKTGLATLGRLPIDQYDRERRGEEVGGDAGLRGRREETDLREG